MCGAFCAAGWWLVPGPRPGDVAAGGLDLGENDSMVEEAKIREAQIGARHAASGVGGDANRAANEPINTRVGGYL